MMQAIKETPARNYLYGHDSMETAHLVDDYPYGFRLRCQIRYWIESKPKFGQRLVSQTLNPKTGRWNTPKKGTYAFVGVMFTDAEDHTHWETCRLYDGLTEAAQFVNRHRDNLTDYQKSVLARWL